MIYLICCLVTFFACGVGTICGMGGGIIIKPVLDATGVMSIATITFLSGCTVIAMTCWSVGKNLAQKNSVIDLKNTTILAVGAAVGGLVGKALHSYVAAFFDNPDTIGGIQAILLFCATLATFVYTVKKEHLTSRQITSPVFILLAGGLLGILGAFLGIGGGPFNVALLCYCFSMPTKKAAQNSLYIVLFSQLASTGKTVLFDGIPDFSGPILVGMILFGILGSELGRRINRKLDEKQATLFFEAMMIFIMLLNLYNVYKYLLQ